MINGINHITLSVTDITESFSFYKDVLFLTPVMLSSRSAYFKAGSTWIALSEEKDAKHNDETYSHIAFNVHEDDYQRIIDLLKENMIESWQDNNTEGESFYFRDPSGNKLEIHYSDLKDRVNFGKEHWDEDIMWFC